MVTMIKTPLALAQELMVIMDNAHVGDEDKVVAARFVLRLVQSGHWAESPINEQGRLIHPADLEKSI